MIDSGAWGASTGAVRGVVMELNLDQARRRAKELLRAARAGEGEALARFRDDRAPRLADAQRAVAQDLGFASWPALVHHVEASRGDREHRRARLVEAALDGRPDVAERLLAHDPSLVSAGLEVALVLGDHEAVAAALRTDPELVSTEVHGRKPLSHACHSVFLRPDSPRAPGVRRVVELLLDHGADVNETFENEYGAMPVLYGAAGVAHDPETTRLLLDRGANPNDGESLYHSMEAEDTACAELLLARGATVKDTNALGYAISMHSAAKVRLLLERGDLTPEDPEIKSALLYAGDPEMVRMLIDYGAELHARDRHGRTPYMRAARFRDPTTRDLLAAAGAGTELDPATDYMGALVRGELERAAAIRAAHANLELTDDDREDLPRWASAGENEIVARLLDAGVPIAAPGFDGGTALHYAAMWGHPSTVELLLARGADTHLLAGEAFARGTALAWTAWGSRQLPVSHDRADAYLAIATILLDAGSEVTEAMIEVASDELAVVLGERITRTG
jgi:ankyrin repeat protein